jgi:hypothetical protein
MTQSFPRGSIMSITNGTLTGTLTEHNRGELSITPERLGNRERMHNGDMRAAFVAIKNTLSVSWTDIPSNDTMTADGFKGGKWMKDFYDSTVGTVTVTLSYDGTDTSVTGIITDFSYLVKRRTTGPLSYDLVDISMSIEEI